MGTVVSQGSMFEAMLGDVKPNKGDLYPFNVRVGVVKFRPPRHEFFEYIQYMGKLEIGPILYHVKFDPASFLTFVFPEAHMSVHEERMFTYKLSNHPEVGQIENVDIITKSPMIIGSFKAESIRILTWSGDEKYENVGKD
jgi:hypothetical protein